MIRMPLLRSENTDKHDAVFGRRLLMCPHVQQPIALLRGLERQPRSEYMMLGAVITSFVDIKRDIHKNVNRHNAEGSR